MLSFIATNRQNYFPLLIAAAFVMFASWNPNTGYAQPRGVLTGWYDDANLNDLFFIDQNQGWAIGDHGVIWQTQDAGMHWKQHPSTTDAQLQAIHFIDSENGWIVGGAVQSYTKKTSGVLLRTRDGGSSWEPIQITSMPMLRDVYFTDLRRGWAVGNPSPMYPSGFFETHDGGKSWKSISTEVTSVWHSLAPSPSGRIHLTGTRGTIAVADPGAVRQGDVPSFGAGVLHQCKMVSDKQGWIVGDGGLVLRTNDSGFSWEPIPSSSPATRKQIDFRAISQKGTHVWITGSPGTVVLHSPDQGETWEIQSTQNQMPLHAIHFVDELHGYAVGALGTILATTNGGITWRTQRGTNQRAALFGILRSTESLSPEIVSRLSGAEGYLSAFEVINQFDDVKDVTTSNQDPGDSFHAAITSLGGSDGKVSWRFPMRSEKLNLSGQRLVEGWNRAHDGMGLESVEKYLVQRIRMWRPDVVLTEYADPQGKDVLSYLINQMVLVAVEKAADATAYSDQITHLKLEPWTVKKIYCKVTDDSKGPIAINTAQVAPQLGMSLSEHAASARGLLFDQHKTSPTLIHYQSVRNTLSDAVGQRDFFAGIHLEPGEPGRRPPARIAAENIQQLRLLAQRRRNVTNIIASAEKKPELSNAWLAQIGDLTNNLPGESGAEILFNLAMQYHRSGRGQLAADVLQLLVEQHPKHPISDHAASWLLQFYSSGEMAHRYKQNTQLLAQDIKIEEPTSAKLDTSVPVAGSRKELNQKFAGEVQLSSYGKTAGGSNPYKFTEKAVALSKRFERTRPELITQPNLAIAMARAYGDQGFSKTADRLLNRLVARSVDDPWHQCAQTELLLGRPSIMPPKPSMVCAPITDRPILDGHLDEVTWQKARPVDLKSPGKDDQAWPAATMLAYDDQFLYIAIRCQKATDTTYSDKNDAARTYDESLDNSDRVELLLDIDRDYSTFYRLSVDSQGRTFESCFGDTTWNPTWYVAASETEQTWTVEAAIPLAELTDQPTTEKTTWALGVQRIAVGTGFQSWTPHGSPEIRPEGFGLIDFR
ncbi:MAG: YCF48-related protein [Pirellulales bacterium]